jgi:hypothetical protein
VREPSPRLSPLGQLMEYRNDSWLKLLAGVASANSNENSSQRVDMALAANRRGGSYVGGPALALGNGIVDIECAPRGAFPTEQGGPLRT